MATGPLRAAPWIVDGCRCEGPSLLLLLLCSLQCTKELLTGASTRLAMTTAAAKARKLQNAAKLPQRTLRGEPRMKRRCATASVAASGAADAAAWATTECESCWLRVAAGRATNRGTCSRQAGQAADHCQRQCAAHAGFADLQHTHTAHQADGRGSPRAQARAATTARLDGAHGWRIARLTARMALQLVKAAGLTHSCARTGCAATACMFICAASKQPRRGLVAVQEAGGSAQQKGWAGERWHEGPMATRGA
jgi:hypothetical protein